MARIIEAKALLTADDQASAKIIAMAKKIESVSKAQQQFAKSGGAQFEAMTKAIANTESKLAAMSGYKKMARDLDAASVAHRRAQQEANRMKAALDAVGGAGGKLARDYDRAARAAENARTVFMSQGRATRQAKADLEAMGIPVKRLADMERHLAQQVNSATQALRRQAQASKNAYPWGAPPKSGSGVPLIPKAPTIPPGMKPMNVPAEHPTVRPQSGRPEFPIAEVGGAIGVIGAVKKTVLAGADVDTERSQARQAGWTDAEIARAEKRSNELAAEYGVSPGSAFNMVREARPTFGGDLDTTLKNVKPFFGVATAMRQKSPHAGDAEINKSVNDTIKAGEILGYSSDPEQLIGYADFMTRMAQVFGTQLRGEEVLNLAKRSKTAGSDVSFDFFKDVLPTVLPELGGDATGTALMTLRQALVGGKMKKRTAENLEKLGLVNSKDMIKTLDEDVVGVQPSAVKGSDVARRNPLQWAEKFLIPAMDEKGVKAEDRAAIISTLFSDRNAEHMINLLVTQRARMKKDKGLVDQALGISGIPQALKDDPYLVGQRVGGAASNVGAALSNPFMGALKAAADAAANGLNSLAEAARGGPGATATGTAAGALAGGAIGWLKTAGSLPWRLGAGGIGAGAGGISGGLLLPYMAQQFLEALKAQGPEGQKQFFGSALPGFAGEIDKSFKAQKEGRRDPEAFRGRAMMNAGKGIDLGSLDLSPLRHLKAVVQDPIDVTGKVQLEGKAQVNVMVKVDGPARVTGMSSSSSGDIVANEGVALTGTWGGPSRWKVAE